MLQMTSSGADGVHVTLLLPTEPAAVHQQSTALDPRLILPLIVAVLGLVFILFRVKKQSGSTTNTSVDATGCEHTEPLLPRASIPSAMKQRAARFTSLDVFRGLTICLMIFVNYGGGGFQLFNHSVWDGATVADLVFPWFAWIMGFGIFLSSHSLAHQHLTPTHRSIMLRSTKLFVLGLFINNGADWSHWRIPGVLQALAVAYAVVALLSSCFSPSLLLENAYNCRSRTKFFASHALLGILPLVVINLSATFLLHVPGCPVGYLGPGGTADGGKHCNCTGGAHLYVDTLLFGRDHLFQTPTCQKRYRTGPYDPEGALNWLMVATTTYLGYVVAAAMCCMATDKRKLQACLVSGSVLLVLSVLSGGVFVSTTPWIPFNKNMWSISYVFLSSGVACVTFAMLFALLDSSEKRAQWDGWPFVSVGKNSVFIYAMVSPDSRGNPALELSCGN